MGLRREIPSGGLPFPPRARIRLLALLACRDEMAYLPSWLENVGPQVDGIVALDDASSDGSAELLESDPRVLEVIRREHDRSGWDEVGNYRLLVDAARRHGGEWALSVDADERLERGFRPRAERVIARGRLFGWRAYSVRLRELWDSPDSYRSDGLWGDKRPERLFRLDPGAEVDPAELHARKTPLGIRVIPADLQVYHLRMITSEDRLARRRRYERLDPQTRWQPEEGYAYLTDDRGLELSPVPLQRGFRVP